MFDKTFHFWFTTQQEKICRHFDRKHSGTLHEGGCIAIVSTPHFRVSPVRRPRHQCHLRPSCFLGTEARPEWRKAHWKVTIRASTWRSEKRHKLSLMHRVELLRYQGIPKSTHQCHLCDTSQELLPILYFNNDKKFTHLVLRDNKVEYFWTPNYECINEGQIACNGI